jgi:hypothetical protein
MMFKQEHRVGLTWAQCGKTDIFRFRCPIDRLQFLKNGAN